MYAAPTIRALQVLQSSFCSLSATKFDPGLHQLGHEQWQSALLASLNNGTDLNWSDALAILLPDAFI